jgi:DNA-binding NarL/FixJ family response regulator
MTVVAGAIVGMMHFASESERRFDARLGSAMTVHVSTRLAVLRALDSMAASWDGALNSREQDIADLAARGLSTSDMARAAGVSPNTIKKYLKRLYAKLGVSCRAELAVILAFSTRGWRELRRSIHRAHWNSTP